MYDEVNAPRQATASGVFYFFIIPASFISPATSAEGGREREKEGGGQLSVIV